MNPKAYGWVALALLIFIASQVLALALVGAATAQRQALVLTLAPLFTIAALTAVPRFRHINKRRKRDSAAPASHSAAPASDICAPASRPQRAVETTPTRRDTVIAALGVTAGIGAAMIVNDWLGLPDWNADLFRHVTTVPLGAAAVAVLGPVAEELVFRRAVIGTLRRHGASATHAVVASAVLFSAVHFNPAQLFFALVAGLLLGLLYERTRSLLACVLCHVANNVYAAAVLSGGGSAAVDVPLHIRIALALCLATACAVALRRLWRPNPKP